eukprot:TRINITY_DN112814_c0_g1_i1.p1 TRINITY_DN112814_c0_g1~~TRINITY_DN112814_c0_g1_i1.p1  ORF type:complete len:689 (+),score=160.01 TRINITY_DN112814_c0_g1_i1:81-2069(+)
MVVRRSLRVCAVGSVLASGLRLNDEEEVLPSRSHGATVTSHEDRRKAATSSHQSPLQRDSLLGAGHRKQAAEHAQEDKSDCPPGKPCPSTNMNFRTNKPDWASRGKMGWRSNFGMDEFPGAGWNGRSGNPSAWHYEGADHHGQVGGHAYNGADHSHGPGGASHGHGGSSHGTMYPEHHDDHHHSSLVAEKSAASSSGGPEDKASSGKGLDKKEGDAFEADEDEPTDVDEAGEMADASDADKDAAESSQELDSRADSKAAAEADATAGSDVEAQAAAKATTAASASSAAKATSSSSSGWRGGRGGGGHGGHHGGGHGHGSRWGHGHSAWGHFSLQQANANSLPAGAYASGEKMETRSKSHARKPEASQAEGTKEHVKPVSTDDAAGVAPKDIQRGSLVGENMKLKTEAAAGSQASFHDHDNGDDHGHFTDGHWTYQPNHWHQGEFHGEGHGSQTEHFSGHQGGGWGGGGGHGGGHGGWGGHHGGGGHGGGHGGHSSLAQHKSVTEMRNPASVRHKEQRRQGSQADDDDDDVKMPISTESLIESRMNPGADLLRQYQLGNAGGALTDGHGLFPGSFATGNIPVPQNAFPVFLPGQRLLINELDKVAMDNMASVGGLPSSGPGGPGGGYGAFAPNGGELAAAMSAQAQQAQGALAATVGQFGNFR